MENTKEKTVTQFTEEQLLKNRIIFLEGDITSEIANDFLRKLLLLSLDNHNPIKVLISSRGGDVDAGMMIVDAIQSSDIAIETYCLEKAYSMGAVVYLSGTGGRYMFPHSKLMLHQPYVKNIAGGDTRKLLEIYESLMAKTKEFDELISGYTNLPVEVVERELSYDHYFEPEEAMRLGMADAVTGIDTILLKGL